MDEAMRRLLICAVLMAAGAASAQEIIDPTIPPKAAIPASQEPQANVVQVSNEPMLQSILIAKKPHGRRMAMIDGILVKVGDKVRDSVVEMIGDNTVMLKEGKTTKVLKLYGSPKGSAPALDKTRKEP